ncbi:tetratricopeptide repeat protein [Thalassospira sp. HF15]|uniref:tetratricopeptide repeat-containing sulfotransferase family protein n=1 Tax=Thalassospira sp. HF15 TaxID=2722755 RepID=UPI0014309400|nr:tetratricopeptide repeat-containing sulfotransferase family protein [Thalassospira sp. HF15]NIY77081.1 tetratricopeptide repeat protein [Thalassospira sp. HF15]
MSKASSTPSFAEKRNRQKADKLIRSAESALASGKAADALARAQQAQLLVPEYPPALLINAKVHRATGNLNEAAKLLQTACNLPDTSIECFHELAGIFASAGKHDLVQQVLFAAIRKFPTHGQTYSDLGVYLIQSEHITQGIAILEKAVAFSPKDWRALNNLGAALLKVGRHKEALEYLARAEKLAPDDPERRLSNLLQLGEALRHMGDLKRAQEIFRQAIAEKPKSGRAWHDLADVMKFKPGSPEIQTMEDILNADADDLPKADREMIGFALGKAYMDSKNPEQAMARLDAANALRRSDFAKGTPTHKAYDSKTACDRVRRIADYFPAELFENLPQKHDNTPAHAFVVGMPRSGSTLTEQILGSHPNILATGELRSFPKFKDRLFGSLFPSPEEDHQKVRNQALLAELASSYCDEVNATYQTSPTTKVIIDKMLGNFSWAGLILLSVPGAKIIHCRRNPVDTCLSCYSKRFTNLQVYTYNQTELGEFYRAYEDLMVHWRAVLPNDRFIEINYEDLVADIEPESRRLIEFLGLSWDDTVLDFHKTERSVRTASAAQVRQGLYQTSVARWKPYAPYIKPLLTALGKEAQEKED